MNFPVHASADRLVLYKFCDSRKYRYWQLDSWLWWKIAIYIKNWLTNSIPIRFQKMDIQKRFKFTLNEFEFSPVNLDIDSSKNVQKAENLNWWQRHNWYQTVRSPHRLHVCEKYNSRSKVSFIKKNSGKTSRSCYFAFLRIINYKTFLRRIFHNLYLHLSCHLWGCGPSKKKRELNWPKHFWRMSNR